MYANTTKKEGTTMNKYERLAEKLKNREKVIGTTTVESMQSGMYYGYAGSVDSIVNKMKESFNGEKVTVIATGGLARMIASEAKTIDVIDSSLTLEGLKIIYDNETEGKETK